jgi:dihydroorotase
MTDRASHDLMLRGGAVFTPAGLVPCNVAVSGRRIAALLPHGAGDAARVIDCAGLVVLPGLIDTQVHFREPGLEAKEDLESGSRAAVMGGVTAVFEMPNTKPATDSAAALADKLARARGRMWTDHAFYVGATAANVGELAVLERLPGCCGVKLFMGASTGDLLVADDATLRAVLASGRRRVAIHAEDEERLQQRRGLRVAGDPSSHPLWRDPTSALLATRRAVAAARATARPVHILHVTTPDELAFLAGHKDIASCEVTPQHLTLAGEDAYPGLGTWAQMNPPIRGRAEVDGLWHWLGQGVPDVLGSDHAPHTRDEKAAPYPASPSGMPGVQTIVPLMLDHVAAGRLSLERLVDLMACGPARLFGLAGKGRIAVGFDADFTIVDPGRQWTIAEDWLQSRCGWSPFAGRRLTGCPVGTIVGGDVAMWEAELGRHPAGRPLRFFDTLAAEPA